MVDSYRPDDKGVDKAEYEHQAGKDRAKDCKNQVSNVLKYI